jgi:hypothetical protein
LSVAKSPVGDLSQTAVKERAMAWKIADGRSGRNAKQAVNEDT